MDFAKAAKGNSREEGEKMTKKTRLFALIVAVMFFAVILFSTAFVVAEADHDCTGDHCAICHQIAICQNTLKQLSLGAQVAALADALTYTLLRTVLPISNLHTLTTLITLKVKLSN